MKSSPLKTNIIVISNILLFLLWLIFILITIIQVIKEQKLLIDINRLTSLTNNLKTNITSLLSQINHHNDKQKPSYYNIFTNNNNNINNKIELTHSNILDIILYPYHSDIITNINELNFIRKHLGNASIHLIYKSSIYGDSAKVFHSKVSTHSHLLFLIKTTLGTKFGGYTSQSLDGYTMLDFDLEVEKSDKEMFVFNLNNFIKYDIIKEDKALFCDENIIFGVCSNNDIYIEDGFTKKESITNFPQCFKGEKYALTLGKRSFIVEELELFKVNFNTLK